MTYNDSSNWFFKLKIDCWSLSRWAVRSKGWASWRQMWERNCSSRSSERQSIFIWDQVEIKYANIFIWFYLSETNFNIFICDQAKIFIWDQVCHYLYLIPSQWENIQVRQFVHFLWENVSIWAVPQLKLQYLLKTGNPKSHILPFFFWIFRQKISQTLSGWHKLFKPSSRALRISLIYEDFCGLKGWKWGQP